MSRVLLVDTNLAALPIYQELLAQGHDVFVVGGNPEDYLAKTVKNYIFQDYADPDSICELLERLQIDCLVPGCNDFSYEVCAEISERVGFKGFDSIATCKTIHNKELFRLFAVDNGIPVPPMIPRTDVMNNLPVIVKPVDSYSGRGITVIREMNQNHLAQAINHAKSHSRSGQYLVEKYVGGQLFSHSAFIKDRRTLLDFIVEEQCIASPFAVDTSRVVANPPSEVIQEIRSTIERMADLLKLEDGLIHTQFILQSGEHWIVEVTRRCPGDLYSLLIEFSTGYKYAGMYINPFLGSDHIEVGVPLNRFIVRHTVTVPEETRFTGIVFNRPVCFVKCFFLAMSGDLIGKAPSGRIGIFFTESETRESQQDIYEDLVQRTLYLIE